MAIAKIHKPETLEECLKLKQETGKDSMIIAGGTDVLVHIHEGKLHATELIDVSNLSAMKGIRVCEGVVWIGAATTFTEVAKSEVLSSFTGLVDACKSVGSPQIRNAGTIGGNLANGSPAADSAPPLLTLGAEVILQKSGASRKVPLHAFYAGKGSTVIAADEVLTAIEFPMPPQGAKVVFEKLGLRNALAISRLSVSVYIETVNGNITAARVASGSLGLVPMRETVMEAFLMGKTLSEDWIPQGMELFTKQVEERLKGRATMPYKRVAVQGVFENALRKIIG